MTTILYDDNMPYAREYFSTLGDAKAFIAGNINPQDLANCEALLVRSTTQVDAKLLANSPKLKFVATATAGFNHLATDELERRNIQWYAAGGCNANAVAEYVIAALFHLGNRDEFDPRSKSVAVVGVGNVGKALCRLLRALDIEVVTYDPPRAKRDPSFHSASFEQVLGADIISLHTPLVKSNGGENAYPTEHMFDKNVLSRLQPNQILINASRGEVVDNTALLTLLSSSRQAPTFVLDCWENEPEIERALIPHLALCTAHIAGHSLEGKANGTHMVYERLCAHLNRPATLKLEDFLPPFELPASTLKTLESVNSHDSIQTIVSQCIGSMYDIENDDSFFRRYMAKSTSFAEIRRQYPVRREWYALKVSIQQQKAATVLRDLGFTIANDRP
ncbi:4-phosphoerythronate dehydrogenase [Glaciecola sp. XM2]|uniref:4-phosphoerythronate dehydrogenase n=1 Tax=Glaciecola sp. XM2 TaxID=1914931 RepID=UPI001BDE3FD4|nr:4-phosphoerythronate dehydrogenase [Glaciecola sp. XM2]MBT1450976.1 4-phosphoerythronate dehydrogenase [Glaciecola sp. XM2]